MSKLTVNPEVMDVYVMKEEIKKKLAILEEFEKVDLEYKNAKKTVEELKQKHELGLKGLENLFSKNYELESIKNETSEDVLIKKDEKVFNTKSEKVKLKSMNAYVSKKYYNENNPEYFKEQLASLGYNYWKQAPPYVICKAMMPIFNEMKTCSSTEYMKLYKEERFNCLPNSNIFKVFGNWSKMIKYLGIEVIDGVKEAQTKEKSSVGMHLVYSELILEDSQLKEIAEKGVNFKVWENKLTKKEILSLFVYFLKKTGYEGENVYKMNYKSLDVRLPSVSCILNIFGSWENLLKEVGIGIGIGIGIEIGIGIGNGIENN